MIPDPSTPEALQRWENSMSRFSARANYKEVWNRQASDLDTAKLAVAGYTDEAAFEATASDTYIQIQESIGFSPHDIVLEIGCGVGRVGRVLSERCFHWIGADISGEMIRHARTRLADRQNVTLVELSGDGLVEFYSNSVDVIYCTIVFMHLYEWDRLRYVQEAFRVLRPGGRIFFDNVAYSSVEGWQMVNTGASLHPKHRPAHLSMCSSSEEFQTYLDKTGFEKNTVRLHPCGRWLGYGHKPLA